MGMSDNNYDTTAKDILVEVEAIEFCSCGKTCRQGKNFDNAYKLANAAIKKKCGMVDFKEFDRCIKEILDYTLYDITCDNCEEI